MEVYGSHVIFANFIQNFVSNYVFKQNLWFFKNKFCFEITKKPLRTRSKQKISHIFYISKVSISQGIQPIYKADNVFRVSPNRVLLFQRF